MEFLVNLFIILACMCVAGFAAFIGWREWTNSLPKRRQRISESRVGRSAVISDPEAPTPRISQQRNFEFLGIPQADGGQTIYNVPAYKPGEGKEDYWSSTQKIITSLRLIGYTNRGADSTDMYELDGGYFIQSCVGKAFLLNLCSLTSQEAKYFEDQRTSLFDTEGKDNIIENFQGHKWLIRTSLGKNKNPKPDERDWSYLEVLSQHPGIGNGLRSVLPPQVLAETGPHNFWDMRASQLDDAGNKTGFILFVLYTEGKLNAMVGRELSETEIHQMQAV